MRVIAATNRDLQKMVDEGKFREDLWYRLNVVRIVMPPLRERRGDIPLLARFFVNKYNERYNRDVKLIDSGLQALQDYTWPGNVRQLQHLIERLTILAPKTASTPRRCTTRSPRWNRANGRWRPWPTPKKSRSAACWRPPAATRAGPPRSWASSARRCTASWSG